MSAKIEIILTGSRNEPICFTIGATTLTEDERYELYEHLQQEMSRKRIQIEDRRCGFEIETNEIPDENGLTYTRE